MSQLTRYVSINLNDGSGKFYTRRPRPQFGCVVYKLNIDIPDEWKGTIANIDLKVPPPNPNITVEDLWGTP